jgi:hypothetical protein
VLSKRREKNILKKFFKDEVQKIYPPIGVEVENGRSSEEALPRGGIAMGLKLRKDIEAIIGPVWKPPQLTRRERRALGADVKHREPLSEPRHPSRWLRRRYQSLLDRLPVLMFSPEPKPGTGRYVVRRSDKALGDIYSTGGRLLPIAADAQLAWHESAATWSKTKIERSKANHKNAER